MLPLRELNACAKLIFWFLFFFNYYGKAFLPLFFEGFFFFISLMISKRNATYNDHERFLSAQKQITAVALSFLVRNLVFSPVVFASDPLGLLRKTSRNAVFFVGKELTVSNTHTHTRMARVRVKSLSTRHRR